jgi:hypothetical protein
VPSPHIVDYMAFHAAIQTTAESAFHGFGLHDNRNGTNRRNEWSETTWEAFRLQYPRRHIVSSAPFLSALEECGKPPPQPMAAVTFNPMASDSPMGHSRRSTPNGD